MARLDINNGSLSLYSSSVISLLFVKISPTWQQEVKSVQWFSIFQNVSRIQGEFRQAYAVCKALKDGAKFLRNGLTNLFCLRLYKKTFPTHHIQLS